MASTHQTPYLGLSKWSGTDKPKRHDFNTDNEKIDTGLFELSEGVTSHVQDSSLHVTAEEKERWSKGEGLKLTKYVGDGTNRRSISLGYRPEFAFVFGIGMGLTQFQKTSAEMQITSAVLTQEGSTMYATLTADGIEVRQLVSADPDQNIARLNVQGATYICLHR